MRSITDYDKHITKFLLVSVISLLIGTIMGVMQVIPSVIAWLLESGRAGHWIDPLAHAHINLVGGVTTGMMGLIYFVLPRILNRPIYSIRLSNIAFWCSFIGVFGFYIFLVARGLYVGTLMHQGVPFQDANSGVFPGLMTFGVIISSVFMGLGYWGFISSVLLTIKGGRREEV